MLGRRKSVSQKEAEELIEKWKIGDKETDKEERRGNL